MSELVKEKKHRYYLTYVTGNHSEILLFSFGVLPKEGYNNTNTTDVIECSIHLSDDEKIITEFYTDSDKDYNIFKRKLEMLEDWITYSDELSVVYPTESEEDNQCWYGFY